MTTLRFLFIFGLCSLFTAGAQSIVAATQRERNVRSSLTRTAAHPAQPSEHVLFSFAKKRGIRPSSGLLADSSGALYGTTPKSGLSNESPGVVYKLVPDGRGYTEHIIGTFTGLKFASSGLIMDSRGALYGTVDGGGTAGGGIAYKLTPSGSGYAQTTLWNFGGGSDGFGPEGGLVADDSGNLYGTTYFGGSRSSGIVFKLSPSGTGYREDVIWTFHATSRYDGRAPFGALLLDKKTGSLYGTAQLDGLYGYGMVFKLVPSGSTYNETVLWNFGQKNAAQEAAFPWGPLTRDASGALYGETFSGGIYSPFNYFGGTVFKLTPAGSGYEERVLWSFGNGQDGNQPGGGITLGANGTLYGTTEIGGANNDGTVFELTPAGPNYIERILWTFAHGLDGHDPTTDGALILDSTGALYGTTQGGGAYGRGAVYKISP